ncbi:LysR family transcriptional regulator [Providencia stuartii]|nr:LysR family transcriptional regulator [Providencia stuartii]
MKAPESGDRLELLNTFLRIVDSGSLSSAARQLNTTQATISRRLKTLETIMGATLLFRNTHSLKLTDCGFLCYENAKQLLANWENLQDSLNVSKHSPTGLLKIRVPHAFGQIQLLESIFDFMNENTLVTVDWSLSDELPNFLKEKLDCSIYVGDKLDPNHIAIPLGEVPRIVVSSPSIAGLDSLETVSNLSSLPWVSLSTFYKFDVTLKHMKTHQKEKINITPRFFTDNLFSLKEAVMKGLGIAVISSWMVTEELKTGKLINVAPNWESNSLPVYMLYPYATYYPERLKSFISKIKADIKNIEGIRS